MRQILIGSLRDGRISIRHLMRMFCFRHEVFRCKLGWDVNSFNGLETDQYDHLDTIYILSLDTAGMVNGCLRLLPTTSSYMLKDSFAYLFDENQRPPLDRQIWEGSRLAVASHNREQIPGSVITLEILAKMFEFAFDNNIREYVACVSMAVEHLLSKKIGLPMQRIGRPQHIG
ncbi:MAG TPA: acyl-homoserine-lactone synthase, partial [Gammaproteobacteria bacterium]